MSFIGPDHKRPVYVCSLSKTENELSDWEMGSKSVEVIESLENVPDYSLFSKTIFISALIVQKVPKVTEATLGQLVGSNFFQLSLL